MRVKVRKETGIKEETLRQRLTSTEKTAWTEAALRDGRDLSNWLRHVANQEVLRVRSADGLGGGRS